MLSNPTYDYQIHQFDRRWTTGGKYERTVVDNSKLTVNVGGEFRYDDIGNVGVDHTDAGAIPREHRRQRDQGKLASAPTPKRRGRRPTSCACSARCAETSTTSTCTAKTPAPASRAARRDSRVSPKVGLAYEVNDGVELYANWGRGFHSNDARGVVNADDARAGTVARAPATKAARDSTRRAQAHGHLLVAQPRQRARVRRRLERRRAEGRLAAQRLRAHASSGSRSTGSASTPSTPAARRATSTIRTAPTSSSPVETAGEFGV